ncbi:hypothetical protein B0H10DRAFT_1288314 [Mycena sp. CBHHK59/15]|nr:hypothetical protein B0H10DRAFT_1288314 [Mycena sp. CBHHK59/15]
MRECIAVQFRGLLCHLAGTKTGFTRDTLKRVRLILHATRSYYGLFAFQVSTRLSDQRNALEKQLRGFIKLASWKDINVQVLKASAQRTHHQLHKIIRKFRDVLRQPVSGHLHPQSAGDRNVNASRSTSPWTPGAYIQLHLSHPTILPYRIRAICSLCTSLSTNLETSSIRVSAHSSPLAPPTSLIISRSMSSLQQRSLRRLRSQALPLKSGKSCRKP